MRIPLRHKAIQNRNRRLSRRRRWLRMRCRRSRGPTRPEPAEQLSERELVLSFGQRRWRVRGLEKVTSFDLLRVNLFVATTDGAVTAQVPRGHARPLLGAGPGGVRRGGRERARGRGRGGEGGPGAGAAGLRGPRGGGHHRRVGAGRGRRSRSPREGRAAALALLRDPDLVGRIEADFAAVGMVGEATNCLVGYLAAVSRKLPAPLAVIVQSTSAAGKSR